MIVWDAFKAIMLFRRFTTLPRVVELAGNTLMWLLLLLLVLTISGNVPTVFENRRALVDRMYYR